MDTNNQAKIFVEDEHGAITVDWVVLTAALTGLVFVLVQFLNEAVVRDTMQGSVTVNLNNASDAAANAIAQASSDAGGEVED